MSTTAFDIAGFWRRFGAIAIEIIVVTIATGVLLSVLYAVSDGRIQSSVGGYPFCDQLTVVPEGLDPRPLANPSFVEDCRIALPGLNVGRLLRVGARANDNILAHESMQTYWLDSDGAFLAGVLSLSFLPFINFPLYSIWMEGRSGQTIGKRLLRIRTIDIDKPDSIGVPMAKVFWRQFWLFTLTAFSTLGEITRDWIVQPYSESFQEVLDNPLYYVSEGIGLVTGTFLIVIFVVAVVRKRSPLYDRLAGTAVVRT